MRLRHPRLLSTGTEVLVSSHSPIDSSMVDLRKSTAGGLVIMNHIARIACLKQTNYIPSPANQRVGPEWVPSLQKHS